MGNGWVMRLRIINKCKHGICKSRKKINRMKHESFMKVLVFLKVKYAINAVLGSVNLSSNDQLHSLHHLAVCLAVNIVHSFLQMNLKSILSRT